MTEGEKMNKTRKRTAKSKPARRKAPPVVAVPVPKPETETSVIAYKGFDANLRCRGFQFEIGKTYEHNGDVKACESGFHACEHPLDVLGYYAPNVSRFAVVKQFGALDRHSGDTKIASAKITIEAEIRLPELIQSAVKWVFDRAKWTDGPVTTKPNEAATASGDQGAATASGYRGAATASNKTAVAVAPNWGRVRGVIGSALFLVARDPNTEEITHAWAGIVGRDGIKPDVWYSLNAKGLPEEAE
jgi:hypothetical protein